MSKYEYDRYDDEHDDKYDDNHKNEAEESPWSQKDIVIPVVEVVAPVTTVVNNVVNVVVNPPEVQVVTNITVVNEQTEDNIVPPTPKPPAPNYIYGTSKNDYLVGTDLDDVIYGYQRNDTLIDGTGADKLYGAKGKNTYRCTADGQVDFVYVKKDKQPDTVQFVGLEDRIDLPGSKFTFHPVTQGIGIFLKNQLQAVYTGDNLSVSQLQSITV